MKAGERIHDDARDIVVTFGVYASVVFVRRAGNEIVDAMADDLRSGDRPSERHGRDAERIGYSFDRAPRIGEAAMRPAALRTGTGVNIDC